jgi:hypothetical protein
MIKFYEKIMNDHVARTIYDTFMQFLLNKDGSIKSYYHEDKNSTVDYRAFGVYNMDHTLVEVDKYDKIIKEDFGNNYEFTHSFTRVYPDKGILHPHVDRLDLDITLTVNVHSIPENPWPIHFSNSSIPDEDMEVAASHNPKIALKVIKDYLNDYSSFVTNIGDGVCCTRNVPHWRNLYNSSFEGDHFMQVFYHWKKK